MRGRNIEKEEGGTREGRGRGARSPVVFEQGDRHCNEGKDEVYGESVLGAVRSSHLHQIEGEDGESND